MLECPVCGGVGHYLMFEKYAACSPACGEIFELRNDVELLRSAIRQFGQETDGAKHPRDVGSAYARLMAVLDA